jgi:preprotein translocase subunit SecD
VVALNLVSRSPAWLSALHASPMYLGLDLRGGVHFMLQVDMQAALTKKAESLSGDIRSVCARRTCGMAASAATARSSRFVSVTRPPWMPPRSLFRAVPDLQTVDVPEGAEYKLTATIKPEAARKIQEQAVKQNITTCTTASTSSAWPSR